MQNHLFYERGGLWYVENRNRKPVPGSPVATEAQAVILAGHDTECRAAAMFSREETRRVIGCYYDPAD